MFVTVAQYKKFLKEYNGQVKSKPYSKMKRAELEAEVKRLGYKAYNEKGVVKFDKVYNGIANKTIDVGSLSAKNTPAKKGKGKRNEEEQKEITKRLKAASKIKKREVRSMLNSQTTKEELKEMKEMREEYLEREKKGLLNNTQIKNPYKKRGKNRVMSYI